MHPDLTHDLFLVKEHVGLFKAANNFDVFDPATGARLFECREPRLGLLTKLLRFTDYKRLTPFQVELKAVDGTPLVTVRRGVTFFRSKVAVLDGRDQPIGSFRQRLLSIGGSFQVLDATDQPLCELQGKWTGWDFRFVAGDRELASVSKKWAGLGKELFTSADNYVLRIAADVPKDSPLRLLILAAVLCIDMVLKE